MLAEDRLLTLLGLRLDHLRSRSVPVRGVHPGPSEGVSRLRWADGTTLLVRSQRPGSMAQVAAWLHRGTPVLVERWERRGASLVLLLRARTALRVLRLGVVVMGPEQPD